jgi:hypothetical protein
MHLHTDVDTTEVDTAVASKDHSGRKIKIKIAEFYASGIQLRKADGSFYALTGSIILKTIGNEVYFVGSAPAGNYTSVTFNVGLSPVSNQTDPSTQSSSSPLSPQNPSMWFGNTTKGYIFMNVQGKVDTSVMNTGLVNFPISYQIGTNALLKTVIMPNLAFAVVSSQ